MQRVELASEAAPDSVQRGVALEALAFVQHVELASEAAAVRCSAGVGFRSRIDSCNVWVSLLLAALASEAASDPEQRVELALEAVPLLCSAGVALEAASDLCGDVVAC